MRNRLCLWAALVLAAGIIAAPLLWPWRGIVVIAFIAAALGVAAWYWWRRQFHPAFAAALVFLGGALLPSPPVAVHVAARVTAVRGWLDGEALVRANRAYAGARVTAWRLGNGPWRDPGRDLRLWLAGAGDAAEYGQVFEARGRLISAVSSGADGYFFPKTMALLPRRGGSFLRRWALAFRGAVAGVYALYLGEEERAVLGGLVFGDLIRLGPGTLAGFRDAGAVHLLSVSGLHVGFVVLLALGLASLFGLRGWRAWLLAAPALVFYTALCGPRPPILRAAIMALAAGAGSLSRRKIDAANLLGLAALIVLILQPRALGSLSFQLSFGACAGLVFLYPRWAEWCPPRLAFAGKPLLVSLAASAAIVPLQAAAFGRLSLVGPLANLVLVPLAGLIVQAGLAAGLVGAAFAPVAGPVLAAIGALIDLFLYLVVFFARLPGAAVNVGGWKWPLTVCYYGFLGMAGFGMERNLLNRRPRLSWGTMTVIFAACLGAFVWWQALAVPRGLAVTFLDVGQGDCVLIRAPGGHTALVDGGEMEAGERVLTYLRRQGINRLDLVFVSHPHSDHVGGLIAVAREMPIGRVLDPGWPHPSGVYREFLLALKARGIPWQRARAGLSFSLGSEVAGEVLHPNPGATQPNDLNDGSLAIRLRYGRQVILLPGDLGEAGEEELLATGRDLAAVLLKAAHHGSATSTGEAWLAAVRPKLAVISAGRGNQFRHPHPETLARLRAARVKVYRTDLRGTVRYWTDGRRYRVECAR